MFVLLYKQSLFFESSDDTSVLLYVFACVCLSVLKFKRERECKRKKEWKRKKEKERERKNERKKEREKEKEIVKIKERE